MYAKRGHQTAFARAIRKYGIKSFTFPCQISHASNRKEADEKERMWILFLKSNDPNFGYNLTAGGEGTIGYTLTAEHRRKIGLAGKGKKRSPESIAKYKLSRTGWKPTDETRAKMSASWTPERRAALAQRSKKFKNNPEFRASIIAAWTPERRAALSEHNRLVWTPERRAKLSARNNRRWEAWRASKEMSNVRPT